MSEDRQPPAAPERIRVCIRAGKNDWIGVAYADNYTGDPSKVHEYTRVSSLAAPSYVVNCDKCGHKVELFPTAYSSPTAERRAAFDEAIAIVGNTWATTSVGKVRIEHQAEYERARIIAALEAKRDEKERADDDSIC